MSNIIHLNGATYFQIQKHKITFGGYKDLLPTASKLHEYISYLVQERSKATVFISALELESMVGLSKGTVLVARAVLAEAGLITFKRGSAGYWYTLTNGDTGKPMVNSLKGETPPLDFNERTEAELEAYYRHHLTGAIKPCENGLTACCPFHEDSKRHLHITLAKGSVWKCHSCGLTGRLIQFEIEIAKTKGDTISVSEAHSRIRDILASTGTIVSALGPPEAVYPYHNELGKLLFEVCRYKGKKFYQRRPDPDKPGYYIWGLDGVRRVLYNLPAIKPADVVLICEGEKDCDNLRRLDVMDDLGKAVAVTTAPMGTARWEPSYSKSLQGKQCIVFPDNDDAGGRHAKTVVAALVGFAWGEARIVPFPEGCKDMSEYLETHNATDLANLVGLDRLGVPGSPALI